MAQLEFRMKEYLRDLGGAAVAAAICGVARTAPYGWMRRGYMNTETLAKLVEASRKRRLGLRLDTYFGRPDKTRRNGKRR